MIRFIIWLSTSVLLATSCKMVEGFEFGKGQESSRTIKATSSPSSSEPQDAGVTPQWAIEVNDAHRVCSQTEDCVGIYVNCSNCSLENCEGIHKDHASLYANQLDCEGFDGPECDYDCHPNQGLTEVVCENDLCQVKSR